MRISEENLKNIIECSLDMIIAVDTNDRIIEFNKAAQETFGYNPEEILGKDVEMLYANAFEHKKIHRTTLEHGRCVEEILNRRKNGEVFRSYLSASVLRDANGNPVGLMGISRDITKQKMLEDKLKHDAYFDSLTNLPNRALFLDRLGASIARAYRQKNYMFAVLFLDLDRFKNINDSLGHIAGDGLLIEIAERIKKNLRPYDVVARIGGDEFAVLLANVKSTNNVIKVTNRIQDFVKMPVKIGTKEVFTTASVGITTSKMAYNKPEDVLRDADTALHRAKSNGKACYAIFDLVMHSQVVSFLDLENSLRRAIEKKEFFLHYQPIVAMKNEETIAGFEALLRWSPQGKGFVPPNEFIPVAEETGLIVQIGTWVIEEACRQFRRWHDRFAGLSGMTISVNISTRQFNPDLLGIVKQAIEETGIEPERLSIEITESVLMNNPGIAAEVFSKLKEMDIKIQMDDFGTGYSSLGYLNRFRFDALKIDRSFVQAMCDNDWAMEIVRTVISMAHNLNIKVIGEGVETSKQLQELKKLGCDYYQGYLFSKPLSVADAENLLDGSKTLI